MQTQQGQDREGGSRRGPAWLWGWGLALSLLVGSAAVWQGVGQAAGSGPVPVVAAENEYGNVVSQIGGRYVAVTSIMSNPNTDPHTFEASTRDAALVAGAALVVQNGIGYDAFMNDLEAASPNPHRAVVVAAQVLGLGPRTPNPHLFYKPGTMAAVAAVVARDLERLRPRERGYFATRLRRFDASLAGWAKDIAHLRATYKGAPVAVTEPVADYMLQAAGLRILTPWAFQAAIMNSTDPTPQDVAMETNLLVHRRVRVFVYNQQAVDSTTEHLLAVARAHHVPVVGVYETMPPGHTYQSWMEDEVNAVFRALKFHRSTATL
jgi:zinc/manganese transport system substrate-binding protein